MEVEEGSGLPSGGLHFPVRIAPPPAPPGVPRALPPIGCSEPRPAGALARDLAIGAGAVRRSQWSEGGGACPGRWRELRS